MKSLALRVTAVLMGLCSALSYVTPSLSAEVKAFRDIKMTPQRDSQGEARGELRADAQEMADLLKIAPLISMLNKAKQEGASDTTQLPRNLKYAKILCLWKIFIASEEVRKVVAQINFDLGNSYVTLDSLTAKRNMTANMLNTFNFLQSGILGTVKESIDFPGGYNSASQELAMTTFGLDAAIPTIGLFIPSLWSRKIESHPNILAHIYNANYRPPDADRSYLWKFMNSPISGSSMKLTRREILVKHWEDLGFVNSNDELRIKKMTELPNASENLTENIRIVTQRIVLLHDLKTHLEEFDASLYELHKAL